MPDYTITVTTDIILDRRSLDRLEDVVYDELVEQGASTDIVPDGGGVTDVAASFN